MKRLWTWVYDWATTIFIVAFIVVVCAWYGLTHKDIFGDSEGGWS